MPYRIYVKLKSSDEIVSGIEIHHGPPPTQREVVDVKLQSGRILKALVRGPHMPASKRDATVVTEIHADEI